MTPTPNTSKTAASMRRAGTIMRSPLEGRGNRDKDKSDGNMRAPEVRLIQYHLHFCSKTNLSTYRRWHWSWSNCPRLYTVKTLS